MTWLSRPMPQCGSNKESVDLHNHVVSRNKLLGFEKEAGPYKVYVKKLKLKGDLYGI